MSIPQEAIEAAAKASWESAHGSKDTWDASSAGMKVIYLADAAVMLEAAAPYLIREARAAAAEEALRAAIEQMKLSEKWFAGDVLKGYREGCYKVQHILGELRSSRARASAIRDGRA